ncbi:acyl--CoA ligase [Candidatus Woesearchaeota archaeon]|nr:acyl--CoA ligase [Candidatus Woesearchaeota archaeon]
MLKYNNWDELLQEYSLKYGDKIALTYTEDDRKATWREFYHNINKIAVFFADSGIKKADRISILTRNSPEFIYSFFAAMKLGAIFNPINPDSTEDEIEFILNDSGSSIVIVEEENLKKVNAIKNKVSSLRHIFGNGFKAEEVVVLEEYLANAHADYNNTSADLGANSSLSDDCLIMYSSGTTGKPKGIVLTQHNIMAEAFSIAKAWHFNEQSVGMCTLPLFFSGGLMPGFLAALVAGGSLVMQKRFSKSKFFHNIAKYKITYTNVVPTILSILLNPPENLSKYGKEGLSSFKLLACSAAPLPVELAVNFEKQFVKFSDAFRVIEAYGLTENSCWCTMNSTEHRKLGSIGKAMDICDVAIMDDKCNFLEVSDTGRTQEGEIVVKGPIIFNKYWNQPEKTAETKKDDWLHTGDLGSMESDGNFYINGRIKEIIIKGGEKISPKAVDDVFYKYPAVIDAATIGIPDKIYGEEIKTYIVRKNDADSAKVTEAELIAYAQKFFSEFRSPKYIEFIDEIPKGPSGKLLRRELLQMHLNKV